MRKTRDMIIALNREESPCRIFLAKPGIQIPITFRAI